ncbi:uncharacterized protein LOC6541091 [Drosophila erecta]|uniref:Gustatory receptor n=1 Tax=Drosophila erecta TaxID=7220 RepID=B3N6K5_DROER|nr:uncharacterized protein LOC6541091 [Drosophila erecta]EDV59221.2 uncharacterized protein Dere_GG23529 [Drosophila erecta]
MIRYGVDTFRGCRAPFRCWLSARDSLMVTIAFTLGITPFLVRRNALGKTSLEQSWYGFVSAILRWLLLAYCYRYINLSNESLIGYFMRNHVSQNMVQADEQLDRLRSPVNFNTVVGQVVLVVLAVVLLDTALVCLAKLEVYASWQLTCIFVYELLANSITICMFCLMTRTVQRRIACLHKFVCGE